MILAKIEAAESNLGYNFRTDEMVDKLKEGIIDPVKVTRAALQNAASAAGTFPYLRPAVGQAARPRNTVLEPGLPIGSLPRRPAYASCACASNVSAKDRTAARASAAGAATLAPPKAGSGGACDKRRSLASPFPPLPFPLGWPACAGGGLSAASSSYGGNGSQSGLSIANWRAASLYCEPYHTRITRA